MSFYIYYYYSHYKEKELGGTDIKHYYTQQKLKDQYEASMRFIEKRYNDLFDPKKLANKYKGGDPEVEEEIFKILNDFQKNPKALIDAATKTTNEDLPSSSRQKISAEDLGSYLDNFSSFLVESQRFLNQFSTVSGDDIGAFSITDLLDNSLNKSARSEARRKAREIYANGKVFSLTKYEESMKERIHLIKTMYGLIAIGKKIATDGRDSITQESKMINDIVNGINGCRNRLLGFLNEESLRDNVVDNLDKQFKKALDKNFLAFRGELSGGKSTKGGFKMKTSDIEIYLDIPEMLDGKEGKLSIKLPGVSIKRTTSTEEKANIHIKTPAKMETLINNVEWIPDNLTHKQNIYHIFALYNMNLNDPAKELREGKGVFLNSFINYFKIATFPSAIGGSLNEDDFAYFFVLNDKVYTILDIMKSKGVAGLARDVTFSPQIANKISGAVAAHEKAFRKRVSKSDPMSTYQNRSKEIYKHISNISFSISLMMKLNKPKV